AAAALPAPATNTRRAPSAANRSTEDVITRAGSAAAMAVRKLSSSKSFGSIVDTNQKEEKPGHQGRASCACRFGSRAAGRPYGQIAAEYQSAVRPALWMIGDHFDSSCMSRFRAAAGVDWPGAATV